LTDTFFEASLLDDSSKEDLCRQLLAEFGVTHINKTAKGELIHSCCLPFGAHKNGDRNPSASLNFKKLTYRCLGCGGKGGLLWFIAACRGEDGAQARQWLEGETGTGNAVMELPKLLQMLDQIYQPDSEYRPPMSAYPEQVLNPWTWEVFHPYLTDGMPEFGVKGRNIPEDTLRKFRIGYAPNYFDDSERVIIPVWWKGELVGWQARRIAADGHTDKYRNSPDFPKDHIFYNFHAASTAIVVEGSMSVLRHWHHQPEIITGFNSHLSDAQLRLLRGFRNVVLWLDNDDAGWAGTRHAGDILEDHTQVWTVPSPYAADPADFPDDLVDEMLDNRQPYSLWAPPTELRPWKEAA
jgi:DNA primase